MTPIRIEGVSKRFGPTLAVDRLTLRVEAGELFFLLGPSGCGKTTLLRVLAGFVPPDEGEVYLGEQRVTRLPPRRRGAGMVFQTYALWPHLTVARNVAYGLQVRGLGRAEVERRVGQALTMVRMEGLGDRRPNQLSGGQQQRVALARALVVEPRVLLLDEPLSNLDARLRDEMREEVRRLHRETGLTTVYVTHDQKDAMALAGRLAVMDRGRLVQAGTPHEVYHRPANRFVASFLGETNFLPGTVREAGPSGCVVDTPVGPLAASGVPDRLAKGDAVVCSVRPQSLSLGDGGAANRIAARVEQVVFLGEVVQVRLRAGETALTAVGLPQSAGVVRAGDDVTLAVAPEQVVVLPAEDGKP